MSLRAVQRQAAQRYTELSSDLSSSLRPQRVKHHTSDLNSTARLLRNSRLFSLPPPIPRLKDQVETSLKATSESDTATLPFPTRAAIITPRSSLAKGDWGLKRPLPDKAFKTTTPVIRLNATDTIDHITDFESASDHVFTLQKWQEMGVPTTIAQSTRPMVALRAYAKDGPLSAFEDSQDPKDIPAQFKESQTESRGWGVGESNDRRTLPTRRWKYNSPWIAGMPAGEFEDYIRVTIKKRRVEFRSWLRQRLSGTRTTTSTSQVQPASPTNRNIMDEGIEAETLDNSVDEMIDKVINEEPATAATTVAESTPSTDDTTADDILRLRAQKMELFEHVWEFLDLPGRFPKPASADLRTYTDQLYDVDQGPPQTHPSAGLSYLRPGPWLHNHASLGPMAAPPAVEARVLQRPDGHRNGLLGVAGIAVDKRDIDTKGPAWRPQSIQRTGGAKLHVLPDEASIDSHGRIKLNVRLAQKDQVTAWAQPAEDGSNDVDAADAADSQDGWSARPSTLVDKFSRVRRVPTGGGPAQLPDLSRFASGAGYKKRPDIKPFDMQK